MTEPSRVSDWRNGHQRECWLTGEFNGLCLDYHICSIRYAAVTPDFTLAWKLFLSFASLGGMTAMQ